MRRIVALLAVVLLVCSCGSEEPAANTGVTVTTSATTTTSSTVPLAPTTTVAALTTATSEQTTPATASIMAPGLGVSAPRSGWIVSEAPYVMWILFWGQPPPDSVAINGETMIDEDPNWHQYWRSSPIDLAPGDNLLHLAVEYHGETIEEAAIPVTYLEGAEELLGWITAAADDSVTVDPTEWNDDQEFPGPEEPDPDARLTLPIADEVRVIVGDEIDVDYEWFRAEVNGGYANHQQLSGFDEWNPNGVYPYTLTLHNGQVVQIWKIPLG